MPIGWLLLLKSPDDPNHIGTMLIGNLQLKQCAARAEGAISLLNFLRLSMVPPKVTAPSFFDWITSQITLIRLLPQERI